MITLYHGLASTCSKKVRLALYEKGLEFESRLVNLQAFEQHDPEYLKLNPNGVVPTLIHDGEAVIDSSVIMEYLDEVFPEIRLTPDGAMARAQMRAWLRFFEEVPTPAVRYPSFNLALINNFKNMSEAAFDAAAASRPVREDFYRRMGQDGFSAAEMQTALDDIAKTVGRMETALAEGGPWIMGGQYTLADIAVAPSIDRMEDLGYKGIWEDGAHPRVVDWFARMKDRPAYATAYYAGARFSEIYPDLDLGRPKPSRYAG